MNAKTTSYHEIKIQHNDKEYQGRYAIERGVITVTAAGYGRKSTQLGSSSPESLARLLLGELINPDIK